MTYQTIPQFTGKIQGGCSETKQQSRIRHDLNASSAYRRRIEIDRHRENKALKEAVKEIWE